MHSRNSRFSDISRSFLSVVIQLVGNFVVLILRVVGVVASICNSAILEVQFRNCVGSIPAGG